MLRLLISNMTGKIWLRTVCRALCFCHASRIWHTCCSPHHSRAHVALLSHQPKSLCLHGCFGVFSLVTLCSCCNTKRRNSAPHNFSHLLFCTVVFNSFSLQKDIKSYITLKHYSSVLLTFCSVNQFIAIFAFLFYVIF